MFFLLKAAEQILRFFVRHRHTYYECSSFNSCLNAISSSNLDLSYFHLNSVSLIKNLDEISHLLSSINHKFSVLAFSETRLNTFSILPQIEGYIGFHNPTVGLAGGTALYVQTLQLVSSEMIWLTLYILKNTLSELLQKSLIKARTLQQDVFTNTLHCPSLILIIYF